MNKKELRELFTNDWFNNEDVDFEVFFDEKLWQRIEEYGKEQRIDELNREELGDVSDWHYDFQIYKKNRIKELIKWIRKAKKNLTTLGE